VGGLDIGGDAACRSAFFAKRQTINGIGPEGGETYASVQLRMRDWYDQLVTDTVAVAWRYGAGADVSLGFETPQSAADLPMRRARSMCSAAMAEPIC